MHFKNFHKKHTYSKLLLENIEALADNESSGSSTCKGLLGTCKFKCSSCGWDWFAIRSEQNVNHKCNQ